MAYFKSVACAVLLMISAGFSMRSQQVSRAELFRHPGVQWLSWSMAERQNYVRGFIEGYGHGVNEACLAADDLFDKDKPRIIGHDGVASTFPSAKCRASVSHFAPARIDNAGPDFLVYANIITQFYDEHADHRDTPISQVMEMLTGAKPATSDEIFNRLTTWKSSPEVKSKD